MLSEIDCCRIIICNGARRLPTSVSVQLYKENCELFLDALALEAAHKDSHRFTVSVQLGNDTCGVGEVHAELL